MSEEQVLPELDWELLPDLDCTPEEIAAGQEYADACGDHELRPFVAIKNANYRCRNRQLITALASLAQSEAERERLREQLTTVLARESAATARHDAKLEQLETKLARERERNQDLRQVVKSYRGSASNHSWCGNSSGWFCCGICKAADALLETKAEPAPVVTGEE